MKKYVIEHDVPGIGTLTPAQLRTRAEISNEAVARLAPDVQWVQTYLTANRAYCVYFARDEALVREHAALIGMPANRIHEVLAIADPATAAANVPQSAKA